MDEADPTILPVDLDAWLGTAAAPVLIDIRPAAQISSDDRLIPGAIRRSPEDLAARWPELPRGRRVVVLDLAGGEDEPPGRRRAAAERFASQPPRRRLCGLAPAKIPDPAHHRHQRGQMGDPRAAEDRPHRLPVADFGASSIRPPAFIYVPDRAAFWRSPSRPGPRPTTLTVSNSPTWARAAPSMRSCASMISIIPPLDRLATIVRGADTSRHDLAPQCGGLVAISRGSVGELPGRSRDAGARDDHLRRALCLVSGGGAKWLNCRPFQLAPRSRDELVSLGGGGQPGHGPNTGDDK